MTRNTKDTPLDRQPDWRVTLPARAGRSSLRGAGANARAQTKHGLYTAEALQLKRALRRLHRDVRQTLDET
jgi:hypothetical protein